MRAEEERRQLEDRQQAEALRQQMEELKQKEMEVSASFLARGSRGGASMPRIQTCSLLMHVPLYGSAEALHFALTLENINWLETLVHSVCSMSGPLLDQGCPMERALTQGTQHPPATGSGSQDMSHEGFWCRGLLLRTLVS